MFVKRTRKFLSLFLLIFLFSRSQWKSPLLSVHIYFQQYNFVSYHGVWMCHICYWHCHRLSTSQETTLRCVHNVGAHKLLHLAFIAHNFFWLKCISCHVLLSTSLQKWFFFCSISYIPDGKKILPEWGLIIKLKKLKKREWNERWLKCWWDVKNL